MTPFLIPKSRFYLWIRESRGSNRHAGHVDTWRRGHSVRQSKCQEMVEKSGYTSLDILDGDCVRSVVHKYSVDQLSVPKVFSKIRFAVGLTQDSQYQFSSLYVWQERRHLIVMYRFNCFHWLFILRSGSHVSHVSAHATSPNCDTNLKSVTQPPSRHGYMSLGNFFHNEDDSPLMVTSIDGISTQVKASHVQEKNSKHISKKARL